MRAQSDGVEPDATDVALYHPGICSVTHILYLLYTSQIVRHRVNRPIRIIFQLKCDKWTSQIVISVIAHMHDRTKPKSRNRNGRVAAACTSICQFELNLFPITSDLESAEPVNFGNFFFSLYLNLWILFEIKRCVWIDFHIADSFYFCSFYEFFWIGVDLFTKIYSVLFG